MIALGKSLIGVLLGVTVFGSSLAGVKLLSVNERAQVTSITDTDDPANSIAFTYDANGNRTSKTQGSNTYEYRWDARNHLTEVRLNNEWVARYDYDYKGLRVLRELRTGNAFRYIYDGTQLIAELNVLGNTIARYHWAGTRLLAITRGQDFAFYLLDGLRTPVAILNQDGTVRGRLAYDAWGNPTNILGNPDRGFGFTGYVADDESGLYYAQQRYYDAELGLFLSEDPAAGDVEIPATQHPYLYAIANPTVYIDPDGKNPCLIAPEICDRMDAETLGIDISTREGARQLSEFQAGRVKGGFKGAGAFLVGVVIEPISLAADFLGSGLERATDGALARGSILRLSERIDSTAEFVSAPLAAIDSAMAREMETEAQLMEEGRFSELGERHGRLGVSIALSVPTTGVGASAALRPIRSLVPRPNHASRFIAPDQMEGVIREGNEIDLSMSPMSNPGGANQTFGLDIARAQAPNIPLINGRRPRNSQFAGKVFPLERLPETLRAKYPNSVEFTDQGFPNFSPYEVARGKIQGLTGDMRHDEPLANARAGLEETPDGYTWHHIEDGQTMTLVPSDLHGAVQHTGGRAVIKHRENQRQETNQ